MPNKLSFPILKDIVASTRQIGYIIFKEKRALALGLLSTLIVLSVAPFLRSGSLGLLVNNLVRIKQLHTPETIIAWSLVFLASALFLPALFNILEFYFFKLFWFFLEEKFELMIIRKKGEMDVAAHEDPKLNDLFNKVKENGLWRIQNFSDRQFYIFQNILEILFAASILFFASPFLLLVLVAGTVPELISEVKYGREVWGIHGSRAEIRRRFWDLRFHFDQLPSLIELKLFRNVNYFMNLIKNLFRSFQSEQKAAERSRMFSQIATLSISEVTVIGAIVWLVFEVTRGHFQVGTLTFLLASIGDLRQSLSGFFSNLGKQYQDGLFVKDVFTFLDIKPVIYTKVEGHIINPNKTPNIFFDNVTFRYPDTKQAVLKNFSLRIAPGEKVAIVGANGAGKTTLVKLLCRFYDPDKGKILIDGHDLKNIDLESWYKKLGVLFQDYSNYHFIVKEAIALGKSEKAISLPAVKSAARASEADSFISEWDKMYDQMLGKQFSEGVEPSIGQWQKLALARTFYRDPRILILDEPTSSVDAEAEAKIFQKLEALPKNRSVILISHRFSTVRQASKICVIKDGELRELGSHEELVKLGKIYARLFKLQAKGYR